MHHLSRADARRVAVRAQLLTAPRPTDMRTVVRGLTMLQVDHTKAVAPSADLVLWSRIGSRYDPDELADAVDDQTLVDVQGMIRPAEDLALYTAEMAAWPGPDAKAWAHSQARWLRDNAACRQDILDALRSDGPLTARDLPDTTVRPWRSSGWNRDRNVPMMLELMVQAGEVAAAGRRGRDRLWDLAERIYPDDPPVPVDEARRRRDERRLHALGIARARGPECPVEPVDVGSAGEAAVVDGVRGEWRVDPSLLDAPFEGRAALLSPFDRLIQDRKRMAELFEFDYALEMYKPAAARRWGYYALPVLHGDRLVGKVDATADHAAGVLQVHAVHEDGPWRPAVRADVADELEDLARWLGLDLHLGARTHVS
ncbi:DNA glycosylase AlkZ-like family protein [Cellulomonas algicola]|uniref:DNA glycosylase AlkZ-like family protein n=1 Tax=Cellulomonas algicola TaxID=2071633 RepID=UPI001C3FADB0|nr:crosslink repair DNA glycosylase YcaQ family protein [Cellulomonas algicola]